MRLFDLTSIDLIDISGGTHFPGAKAGSDGSSPGPYYLDFARKARDVTSVPLMVTGGFKNREQAVNAIDSGAADMVGIARAVVLNPSLPKVWLTQGGGNPVFPEFEYAPPGGIIAWYTMRLTALSEDRGNSFNPDLPLALHTYEERDAQRCKIWQKMFSYLSQYELKD